MLITQHLYKNIAKNSNCNICSNDFCVDYNQVQKFVRNRGIIYVLKLIYLLIICLMLYIAGIQIIV